MTGAARGPTLERRPVRPPAARRSWLFLPGADAATLTAAPDCAADVLIQELEDFTPPERRAEARALSETLFAQWRQAGKVAAVRINPLETEDGPRDLAAAMAGKPDLVLLPKAARPEQVAALAAAVREQEARLGLAEGSTELVPNVESAAGLRLAFEICRAATPVTGCLVASEDMAADLGAERGRDGAELAYVRARFHAECTAAGVVSIDCPYTWSDADGLAAETRHARRLGYTAKSAVLPEHCAAINAILTPAPDEVEAARRRVEAFERARGTGRDRAEVDGHLVEMPTYLNARRLLERHRMLSEAASPS